MNEHLNESERRVGRLVREYLDEQAGSVDAKAILARVEKTRARRRRMHRRLLVAAAMAAMVLVALLLAHGGRRHDGRELQQLAVILKQGGQAAFSGVITGFRAAAGSISDAVNTIFSAQTHVRRQEAAGNLDDLASDARVLKENLRRIILNVLPFPG